ncbi:MAG: hypothetical protein AAB681_02905 [Patescibacteria group bacterium]
MIIKHTYTKKELKDLGPPFRQQIGSDIHILRAIKPEIAEEFFERVQKRIDLSYNKPAEILKRVNANRRVIILNC